MCCIRHAFRRQPIGEIGPDRLGWCLLEGHGRSGLHRRCAASTQHDIEHVAKREFRFGHADIELEFALGYVVDIVLRGRGTISNT